MTHVAQDIKPAEHRCSDPLAALNADLIPHDAGTLPGNVIPFEVPPGIVDRPLRLTLFDDYAATVKYEQEASLRAMVPALVRHTAAAKAQLPWIKLARFGDTPSPKGTGSLRHDGNIVAVSGLEADYDAGRMGMDEACRLLRRARVAAVVYTSPRATDAAPRWRVLCPLAADLVGTSDELRERRAELVGRVNGVLGGVLSPESFTLSQSYYWGSVNSNPAHRVVLISGDAIDQRHDLPAVGVPAPKAMKERQDDGTVAPAVQPTGEPVPADCLRAMLACLHPGMGRQDGWLSLIAALHAAPIAGGDPGAVIRRGLAVEWSRGDLHGGTAPATYTSDQDVVAAFDTMPPKEGGINVGTLIQMAREAGYTGPVTVAEGRTAEEAFGGAQAFREVVAEPAKAEAKHDSSTRTGTTDAQRRAERYRVYTEADIPTLPDVRAAIAGLLVDGSDSTNLLAGTLGAYKTFVAAEIALALTSGKPCFGTLPITGEPGPVVWFVSEGCHTLMKKRWPALRCYRGIPEGQRLPIHFLSAVPPLASADDKAFCLDRMREIVKHEGALRMVCFDTLARMQDGLSGNDDTTANAYTNLIETVAAEFNCPVWTNAHTGKVEGKGTAGSSRIEANTANVYYITADPLDARTTINDRWAKIVPHRLKDQPEWGAIYLKGVRIMVAGENCGLALDGLGKEAFDGLAGQSSGGGTKGGGWTYHLPSLVGRALAACRAMNGNTCTTKQLIVAMRELGDERVTKIGDLALRNLLQGAQGDAELARRLRAYYRPREDCDRRQPWQWELLSGQEAREARDEVVVYGNGA